MKTTILNTVKMLGLYLLIVVGGTTLFMIVSPLAGYLPYGDRPGPGWQGKPFEISFEGFISNAQSLMGWALFLSPYAVVIGLMLLGLARALERIGVNRIAMQLYVR